MMICEYIPLYNGPLDIKYVATKVFVGIKYYIVRCDKDGRLYRIHEKYFVHHGKEILVK